MYLLVPYTVLSHQSWTILTSSITPKSYKNLSCSIPPKFNSTKVILYIPVSYAVQLHQSSIPLKSYYLPVPEVVKFHQSCNSTKVQFNQSTLYALSNSTKVHFHLSHTILTSTLICAIPQKINSTSHIIYVQYLLVPYVVHYAAHLHQSHISTTVQFHQSLIEQKLDYIYQYFKLIINAKIQCHRSHFKLYSTIMPKFSSTKVILYLPVL